MSALPDSQPGLHLVHYFHADAFVLDANIEQPVQTEVRRQGLVDLPQSGQIQYDRALPYGLKGLISYGGGYTQVSGHPSTKLAEGFTTVATSVVEDLNVLDVLTADRVVGQISTTHPPFDPRNGLRDSVPSVTFLGTRFDNLRIDGHEVEPQKRLDILGPKPQSGSYLEDTSVLENVKTQYDTINNVVGLPEWARTQYRGNGSPFQDRADRKRSVLRCSMVNSISKAPGLSFGHVIDLPHFGRIFLGELEVRRELGEPETPQTYPDPDRYTFHLTMIRLDMGCLAKGTAQIVALDTNGTGSSGGHKP